ncbi:MAG: competence/damage-inducible protein A [Syntrophomonas sp.]|nr:competence/damage-inducible protein A [Syntrophomonas sp.]
MKKAFIISTGTELLSGSTLDSNSVFLSRKLGELGIKVVGKSTVGDNREQISRAFIMGMESADTIISSGGLGPTFDDITKNVVCELMGCGLELREDEVKHLQEYFELRKRPMPEINLRQAMFPAQAIALKNSRGTAPGMYLKKNNKIIILLPGPPREMTGMYTEQAEPLIIKDFGLKPPDILTKNIKILGLSESQVEERLGDLTNMPECLTIALLAANGEIHIRLTAESDERDTNLKCLAEHGAKIIDRMGRHIFAFDDETLVSKVAGLLQRRDLKLAVAESCTGGLLSKMITELAGSSAYFWGGVVSYSNQSKQRILGIKEATLNKYGPVSSETAWEMAENIRNIAGSDLGLSITGIAGPGGGSAEKPVGLVYIGMAYNGGGDVKELRLGGGRDLIRIISAKSALDMLRRYIEYRL